MTIPRPAAALALTLALLAPPARAAETQWWVSDVPADYARAESRGVVVGSDGALGLGPRTTVTRAESLTVVWALAPLKDGSVAIAGDRGRLMRWSESGGIRPWVRLPVGQVLSLIADGDGVVAGTGPDGLIYRIGARGDTSLIARTGERYVWGVARAAGSGDGAASAWYAATGTRGRLLRVERGRVRIVVDTDESNLVSILADGRGGVYAGGDSHGRIIHAAADGALSTTYDASEDEIHGLARGADGALYAAALTAAAVSDESPDHDQAEAPGGGPAAGPPSGPAPARSAVSDGRATIYRIVPDSSASVAWSSTQPFIFALASLPRGVAAATGSRAGVYLVDRGGASLWLAAPQGQVTALAVGRDGALFAATSNPAALWRLGPGRAERGELTGPVLDAKRIARFGRIQWHGETHGGAVELLCRSGNTDPPDTTWSKWSGGKAGEDGLASGAPAGRYFQWKIFLSGGDPRVESVEASWREQNLAPRVEDVVLAPQGQAFREGDIQPRIEPVTQSLPGGQKVEYTMPPAQGARALRELPIWARGLRTIQWHAVDPNGDSMRYRVDARAEGGSAWIKVAEDLDAPTYTWDTATFPDGRYRLRVTASDEDANPLGEGGTGEALSAPITIDNTPPVVTAFEARGEPGAVRVEGRAEDAESALSRIEVAADDGDWRVVTPDGGFADRRTLSFHGRLPDLKPGEHTVGLRVVDGAGNYAQRSTRVTVPATR